MITDVTYVIMEASARNCLVAFASLMSFSILMATLTPLYSPSHTSDERERGRKMGGGGGGGGGEEREEGGRGRGGERKRKRGEGRGERGGREGRERRRVGGTEVSVKKGQLAR